MKGRGMTLLEVVVVLAITVVALTVALPIFVALLREQKGLASEILDGETLPQLHTRLDHDLGAAQTLASVSEKGVTSLVLAPRAEKAPTIVWTLVAGGISRREVPGDGTPEPPAHTWSAPGTFTLVEPELAAGRLALLWSPFGGAAELLVFELPRPEEAIR